MVKPWNTCVGIASARMWLIMWLIMLFLLLLLLLLLLSGLLQWFTSPGANTLDTYLYSRFVQLDKITSLTCLRIWGYRLPCGVSHPDLGLPENTLFDGLLQLSPRPFRDIRVCLKKCCVSMFSTQHFLYFPSQNGVFHHNFQGNSQYLRQNHSSPGGHRASVVSGEAFPALMALPAEFQVPGNRKAKYNISRWIANAGKQTAFCH